MSKSFEYNSLQSSNYRSQGLDKDAERAEHFMRKELSNLYESSYSKEYSDYSRRYYEAKSQGREESANTYKRFMDAAMIKMMEGK